jgi:hypothetical protein
MTQMKSTALAAALAVSLMGVSNAQVSPQRLESAKAIASEELPVRFARADTNKNGCLTRDEANAGMPRVHTYFDEIDTDKKACITLAQIQTFMQAQTAESASALKNKVEGRARNAP